jgi:glutaredoxin
MIFYTTHCPKCKVLKMKLDQKNIQYEENENIEEMISLGISSAPAIFYEGKIYTFADAIRLVNSL